MTDVTGLPGTGSDTGAGFGSRSTSDAGKGPGFGGPAGSRSRHDLLVSAWSSKPGLPGFLTAVNHKQIGLRFIWTAVVFLGVGGVEALLLRIQLARPENTFLSPEAYNQIFTMHGTTMMFLFAVPALEGLAMYLVPLQLGARDLPFPRLNAFGYWIYLAGGLLLNWSLLTGSVPDGGWFAYPPLSGPEFSPSRALDFWLLGVTFAEVAALIGAVELIVLVLRFRAPGMSLGRVPLLSWSALVMGAMILFAFPFVIVASSLLEIERKFSAPFYEAEFGGSPLLWQHLFWIFGHPEVYIILVPAIGIVSSVVAVHTGIRVVAYPLVVASLVGIAIVSFGLWVHHMFTVGLPVMATSLFAVASSFIAVPSGITVFAWIATIWEGRPRWSAPMWLVVGFLAIFVLGGITGVMVAAAPFDHQAHDTYFVVAHFHYVLIGGGVFPVLAGLHHWFPKMTGRLPSDRGGKVAAAVLFVGFNVTFFPQHWLGLQGMVRRVYTYDTSLGWETSNRVSTIGAFVLASGFLAFFANLAWAWRRGREAGPDPWRADTLEWAVPSPPPAYNFAVVPTVGSLTPLWDDRPAELHRRVLDGVAVTARPWRNRRELIQTSVIDARPERIIAIPGPSYWPLITAVLLTLTLIGVLVNWVVLFGGGGLVSIVALVMWNVSSRRAADALADAVDPDDPERILRLRADEAFADHTAVGAGAVWWASAVGMVAVATVTGAAVYAYFYLRLGADRWPLAGEPPPLGRPLVAVVLVAMAVVLARSADQGLVRLALSGVALAAAIAVELVALARSDQPIDGDAYTAMVVTLEVWAAVVASVAVLIRTLVPAVMARGITPAGGAGRTGDAGSGDAGSSDPGRDVDAVVFAGAVAIWLVVWAVVHITPRLT